MKKGRKPDDYQRRGYETPWRESKLFTLFEIDDDGKVQRRFPIQADGTTGDRDEQLERALGLMRGYCQRLDIAQAREVTLLGDGAPWIWNRIPALLCELGLPADRLVQIIDYYHAKEHLNELVNHVHDDVFYPRERIRREATDMLFNGQLDTMRSLLQKHALPGHKRSQKKEIDRYFLANAQRMRYHEHHDRYPIGSGCVESAVRRVINLRIKSPAIFWKDVKAETMIFLRGKLLYGRWPTFTKNWLKRCRGSFQPPRATA